MRKVSSMLKVTYDASSICIAVHVRILNLFLAEVIVEAGKLYLKVYVLSGDTHFILFAVWLLGFLKVYSIQVCIVECCDRFFYFYLTNQVTSFKTCNDAYKAVF